MNLSIKYKLLLTFFLATVVVIGGMLFLMYWSFERGFLQYVNTIEEEAHKNLIGILSEEYQEQGGWEILQRDRERWYELQLEGIIKTGPIRDHMKQHQDPDFKPRYKPRGPEGKPPGARREHRHWFPRKGRHFPKRHLVVLDTDKNVVVGRMRDRDMMELKPILADNEVVGYLGTKSRKILSDTHDLRFSKNQTRAFTIIALFTLIITSILILPLSRSLVKPINKLAQATRDLTSGNYGIRIPVSSNDEIGQLSRDFNTLANTLEKNETARRQWIADISHELRTPLAVLRGEIEAMQDGIRETAPDRLAALHNEVMNLNRLVDDLYELSLSDIGALSYQKQKIQLSEVLESSLTGLRDDFSDKRILTSLEIEDDGIKVFADPDRLQQLFTNLLTNSCRYTDEGGELKVSVRQERGKVTIDFQDSAPAVPETEIPKIFERLYRIDSSRNRSTGGAGLGLSICKNIVEAHDGEISARPSPLGGLWVHIELPVEV